eukprot:8327832-Alexandrium_andersonii.AAC.1
MSAKTLCTIAYHGVKAGAANVEDLAVHPAATRQAERVRTVMGTIGIDELYTIKLPMWDHTQEKRYLSDFPVNLPHEQFARAYAEFPE